MADRYWVGGSGTWTASGSSANWSTTDGGPSGASSPTSTDNAFFTANSNVGTDAFTVTTAIAGCTCANLTISDLDGVLTITGTNNLNVYGSLSLPSTNLVWSLTGSLNLQGTSTSVNKNITTNGFVITSPVTLTGAGTDQWVLQDAFTVTNTFTLTNGTINLNDYTLTCTNSFSTNNGNTRSIAFGTLGSIVITGAGAGWSSANMTNFSYTGTSNVRFTNSGATGAAITTSGATSAQAMNFYITAGTYILTLTSTGRVKSLDFTGFSGSVTITTGGTFTCYGDIIYSATMTTTSGTGTLIFGGNTVTQTFTTNGVTQNYNMSVAGTSNTVRLIGNFTQLSTRSVTLTTGTLDINSVTTSIGIFTILTGTHAIINGTLNCATVTHTSGDLAVGTGYNVVCSGTYTFTAGTITINDGVTLTVRLFSSSNANVRTIQFGSGKIRLTGTGVVWDTSTLTNFGYNGQSYVTVDNNTATATTITPGSGTILNAIAFYIVSGTYSLTLSTGTYYSLDFTGFAGTAALTTTTHTMFGNLNLGSTATTSGTTGTTHFIWNLTSGTRTITSNGRTANFGISMNGVGQTLQLADAFVQGSAQIFSLTSGTFDMAGYSTSLGILTILTGTHAIANGTLNCASVTHTSGALALSSTATVTCTGTYTYTAGSITIADSTTLTVFAFSSNVSNTRSIAFNTSGKIDITGGGTTVWITNRAGFTVTGTSLVRLTFTGGSGIPTTTVSTGSGNATQTLNFAITAGSYPITTGLGGAFKSLDFTGYSGALTLSTSINMYGNLVLSNTMSFANTGTINFNTTTAYDATFTSNNKTIPHALSLSNTGNVTFTDDFSSTNTILRNASGTITANANVTATTFNITGNAGLGSGTWTVTGAGAAAWTVDAASVITAGTSTITMTSSSAKTFAGAGKTYYNLIQGGIGTLTVTGSNSFNDIAATAVPSTVTLTSGTTQTVSNFALSGTIGNLVTLNSSTPASAATLSKSSGIISVSYLSIQDSIATGGATWNAFTSAGSIDNGGNTGWNFSSVGPVGVLSNMIAFF